MIDETQQRFRQEDEARHRHAMKQAEAAAAQLRKVGPFHVRCSVGAAAASRGSPANHCRAFVLRGQRRSVAAVAVCTLRL